VLIILLSSKRRLMGQYANSPLFNAIAWVTVVTVVTLALTYLIWTVFFPSH